MGFFDMDEKPQDGGDKVKKTNQKELLVKLPGGTDFVFVNNNQVKRVYEDDMPALLIIIDEVAELLMPDEGRSEQAKENNAIKSEIQSLIKSITQVGRAFGVHMLLTPLRLSTLVPTIYGIKKLVDIKIGDYVFNENGYPTKVIDLSEIKTSSRMFRIDLDCNRDIISVYSDGDHRFPVFHNGVYSSGETVNDIGEDWKNYSFVGYDCIKLPIVNLETIENELVRCILIEGYSHQFMICGDTNDSYNISKIKTEYICDSDITKETHISEIFSESDIDKMKLIISHNTQRNDTKIISGVIQSNPLDINTEVYTIDDTAINIKQIQ